MADNYIRALAMTAPGTTLREALDNILKAKTGALILIADLADVRPLIEGGFELNIDFSPQMLYELAKMDGGILVSSNCAKITYANIHFVTSKNLTSQETGIRHRTAEQIAKQTGALAIAISQRRNMISLYQGQWKYVLPDTTLLLTKVNQAVQALDRYKLLFEQALVKLSALEFGDHVTLSDVGAVLQRAKTIVLLLQEVKRQIIELGTEGNLIFMQSQEIDQLLTKQIKLVMRDYWQAGRGSTVDIVYEMFCNLDTDVLFNQKRIYELLGYTGEQIAHNAHLRAAGYRLLEQVPRIPRNVIENLVEYFGSINAVLVASSEQLDDVEGIGKIRAQTIRQGLNKLKRQVEMELHY